MRAVFSCPDAQTLQQGLLGRLHPPAAERLEEHLLECPACVQAARALEAEDPFLAAVRAQAQPGERPRRGDVRDLITRLRELPARPTPRDLGLTTTPLPAAAGRETYDFLAPAQGSGELGRLGPYRVLRKLGAGGMGIVFEAEDLGLRRRVALKVMAHGLADQEEFRERFLREARAAAAIEHGQIVPIYQVGEEKGVPYLAMKLLQGETLEDRVKRERRLPVAEVLRIGREIAAGLAAAHDCGLIHRDIKPANIWLESPGDRVKLVDFGLARPIEKANGLTSLGDIIGTPGYLAPEQARGESVDSRSDLFSLGCVLYRMATGELPFRGDSKLALLTALETQHPEPPLRLNPDLPPRLAHLIQRLLAKSPADRPSSAQVVVQAIEEIERAPKPAFRKRRGRILLLAGMAAGLLLLALGGVLLPQVLSGLRDRQPDGTTALVQATPPTPRETNHVDDESKPFLPGKVGKICEVKDHPSLVRCLAISPDSRRGLSGSDDKKIRLLDLTKCMVLGTMEGHKGPITAVIFSADGRRALSGDSSGAIILWDLDNGKEVARFEGHKGAITSVALTRDGRLALSGSGRDPNYKIEGTVRVWDVERKKERFVYDKHGDVILGVTFSTDEQSAVSISRDNSMRTWKIEDGELVDQYAVKTSSILPAIPLPDGRVLLENWYGGRASELHDPKSKTKPVISFTGHDNLITAMAVAPESKRVFTGSIDRTGRLWDMDTGNELKTGKVKKSSLCEGHKETLLAVALSRDGRWGLTSSEDKTVVLWGMPP